MTRGIRRVTVVNAAEMVRRQCPARTPLADCFRILLDLMQVTSAHFNVSGRRDNQLFTNKILAMVDGASLYIDGHVNQGYRDVHCQFLKVSVHGWRQRRDIPVESGTYPLIEFVTALAPVLPTATSLTVDSYTLLNIRGGHRFGHHKAEVAIAVGNALNDQGKNHLLDDRIGRRVKG